MLTPSAVANAKPQANPYKLADERGMYLLVKPAGAKWWRVAGFIAAQLQLTH